MPQTETETRFYFWNRFYPYISYLVESAAHLRLQELCVTYNIPMRRNYPYMLDWDFRDLLDWEEILFVRTCYYASWWYIPSCECCGCGSVAVSCGGSQRLRNAVGVWPVIRLKRRLKWWGYSKPSSEAVSQTLKPFISRFFASPMTKRWI